MFSAGIVHAGGEALAGKIERNPFLVEQESAAVDFDAAHGEIKELVGGNAGAALCSLRRGLVGSTVGRDNQMNGQAVEDDLAQRDLAREEGNDFETQGNPVRMNIGFFGGTFEPVNGQPASLEPQLAQVPGERLQFNPAAGHVLQFGHDSGSDPLAKRIAVEVKPQPNYNPEQHQANQGLHPL